MMIEDDFVETSDVEELAGQEKDGVSKSMHFSFSPSRWGSPERDELLEDPPRKRIKVCLPCIINLCGWSFICP